MARHPLVLSAHPSAWIADAGLGGRMAAQAAVTCQFCGQPTMGWQVPYHLNDDHDDESPANLAVSCPLCHLPQHLNRPTVDDEAILIWLPEMAQAALIVLARQIHLACAAEGLSPTIYGNMARTAPTISAAYRAYRALYERSAMAELRLGTQSPRQLGAALRELTPPDYERRSALLGGVRMLPLGRFFEGAVDIYPTMLRDWGAPAAPSS
jgi:intracellular multiplication protein IcmJ